MSRAGGSMGGKDPRKHGPIRSLVKHYAKMKHPFRQCVADNTKRFGPTKVKAVCAWIKDQGRGTTYWRGNESRDKPLKSFREAAESIMVSAMLEEGYSTREIDEALFEADLDVFDGMDRPHAVLICEAARIPFDPNGFDEPCPECHSLLECEHVPDDGVWADVPPDVDTLRRAFRERLSEAQLSTANEPEPRRSKPQLDLATAAMNKGKGKKDKAGKSPGVEGDDGDAQRPSEAAQDIARDIAEDDSRSATSSSSVGGLQDTRDEGQEIFRSQDGTTVYESGAVKDGKTGMTRYPVRIFPDGSVRYDDGSTARPGSIAATGIISGLSVEERMRLYNAGAKGVATKDLAEVQELISDAVGQQIGATSEDAGIDQVMASNQAGNLLDPSIMAEVLAGKRDGQPAEEAGGGSGGGGGGGASGPDKQLASAHMQRFQALKKKKGEPIKVKRGEKVTTGPQGGRGVWRAINGNPVFIKIGQSEEEAQEEAAQRRQMRREKKLKAQEKASRA